MEPTYTLKKLGIEVGETLRARLADLDAAESLAEVPIGIDFANSTPAFIPIHLLHDHYLVARADHVDLYGGDTQDLWDVVRRIQLTNFQDIPR